MSLLNEIDARKREISTDGYPMSIGELISLYKEGALDVHPEFQRIFRWSIFQKSQLIESIVLGIPIPSIFVSQKKNGVWDVVDGQQRISTILEFVGELKDEQQNLLPPSKLVKTKYLPSLEGVMWSNQEDLAKEFNQDLKFIFKREKIDVKIVKRESDENVKYELFQRLNTLGSKLSDQEVRNCILVMIKPDFFTWLKRLSDFEPYRNVISLADRLIDEQYHVELILRFFILKRINLDEVKTTQDLGEFITDKMVQLTSDQTFNLTNEELDFTKTFEILDTTLGSDSFKKYNANKNKFEGSFLISGFEAIGIALGKNINLWDGIQLTEEVKLALINKIKKLWITDEFQRNSGTGVNVTRRAPAIIPLGQTVMRP